MPDAALDEEQRVRDRDDTVDEGEDGGETGDERSEAEVGDGERQHRNRDDVIVPCGVDDTLFPVPLIIDGCLLFI